MSYIIETADGLEKRFYTYNEIRHDFRLPSGPVNVKELSDYLADKAAQATAGNCNQSAEDAETGIIITTTW